MPEMPPPDMQALVEEYRAGWPSFGCARCNKAAQDHKHADHAYQRKTVPNTPRSE